MNAISILCLNFIHNNKASVAKIKNNKKCRGKKYWTFSLLQGMKCRSVNTLWLRERHSVQLHIAQIICTLTKYEYECFVTHFSVWKFEFALLLLFVLLLSKSIRIHLNICTPFTHDNVERHRNAFQPNLNAFGLSVFETSFFSLSPFFPNPPSLNIPLYGPLLWMGTTKRTSWKTW